MINLSTYRCIWIKIFFVSSFSSHHRLVHKLIEGWINTQSSLILLLMLNCCSLAVFLFVCLFVLYHSVFDWCVCVKIPKKQLLLKPWKQLIWKSLLEMAIFLTCTTSPWAVSPWSYVLHFCHVIGWMGLYSCMKEQGCRCSCCSEVVSIINSTVKWLERNLLSMD